MIKEYLPETPETDYILLLVSPSGTDFTLSAQYKEFENIPEQQFKSSASLFHLTKMDVPEHFGIKLNSGRYAEICTSLGLPADEFALVIYSGNGTEILRTNDILRAAQIKSTLNIPD